MSGLSPHDLCDTRGFLPSSSGIFSQNTVWCSDGNAATRNPYPTKSPCVICEAKRVFFFLGGICDFLLWSDLGGPNPASAEVKDCVWPNEPLCISQDSYSIPAEELSVSTGDYQTVKGILLFHSFGLYHFKRKIFETKGQRNKLEGQKTLPAVKLLSAEFSQKKSLLARGCISEQLLVVQSKRCEQWDQCREWPSPLLCRQAKEIVLKYEGRLTRTRGYQAAGAEVWLLCLKSLKFLVPINSHLQFWFREMCVCYALLITSAWDGRGRKKAVKSFFIFFLLFFFPL